MAFEPMAGYGFTTGQSFGNSYSQSVSQAQDSYANVMAGYGALKGQIASTLGYGGTPWGVAAPAAQAIADVYAQQQGRTAQGLINSGLGNSTILGSMQQGNALSAGKAYASLGAQLAQTYAGYQGQVGLAQLGYQGAYHPTSTSQSTQGSIQRIPYPIQQGSARAGGIGGGGGDSRWSGILDRDRVPSAGSGYSPYGGNSYGIAGTQFGFGGVEPVYYGSAASGGGAAPAQSAGGYNRGGYGSENTDAALLGAQASDFYVPPEAPSALGSGWGGVGGWVSDWANETGDYAPF